MVAEVPAWVWIRGKFKLIMDRSVKMPEYIWSRCTLLVESNSTSFANYWQTIVRWDEQKCETELIKTFPPTQIPQYYSYNGTVSIGHRLCEQWIWKTGGHNAGQPTSLSSYSLSYPTNAEQKRYAEISGALGPLYGLSLPLYGLPRRLLETRRLWFPVSLACDSISVTKKKRKDAMTPCSLY